MTRYRATFTGRILGALGTPQQITAEVYGETEAEAVNALYSRFEHIGKLTLTEAAEPMTIYQRLRGIGCEMDSHASDLYVLDTPHARREIEEHARHNPALSDSAFSGTDGRRWIELPFHFDPFWDAKRRS